MDINGQFWWEVRFTPIECSKKVDPCQRMYKCIVGMGDERQVLILGFVAWLYVSDHLLLEDLVEASSEAICLRMVRGGKHLLDT